MTDRPFTDRARIRAAVWGYGPRAVTSGLAAAWWLDITRYPPETVEVTVPAISNPQHRYGIRTRRRDLAPTRRLLRAADIGAHSEAERILVTLLRQARITGWKANQRLGCWEIDVLFRDRKIVIEVDGLAFHCAVCSSRKPSSPLPKPSNAIGSSRTNSP